MTDKPEDKHSNPQKEKPDITQPSKKGVKNNPSVTQPSKSKTPNPRYKNQPKQEKTHKKASKLLTKRPPPSIIPNKRQPSSLKRKNSQDKISSKSSSSPNKQKHQQKFKVDKYQLLIILFFFVGFTSLISLSSYLGYQDGKQTLNIKATNSMKTYLEEQYALGLQDMAEGRNDLARQRFEFIIQSAPSFQEAFNRWVELMVTASPKNSPTPIITPTEDLRPIAELFSQANQLIISQDWNQALDTLSSLRKADPAYQTVWVDNMMYLILRNRGVEKILYLGQLESGIYDFALAEQFGPLDNAANNYREWARLYLRGNSFWVAYPEIAIQYYSQVAGAAPNLKDESGFTAFYRYWASLRHIADQFANSSSWCEASDQYQVALNANKSNSLIITATYAFSQCSTLTPTITPTLTNTIPVVNSPSPTPSPQTSTSTPSTETMTMTPTINLTGSITNTLTPTDISATTTPTLTPIP